MTTIAITNFLAVSLSFLFGAASLLHLAAPRFLREAYRRWDFARGFYYVAGIAQAFAALFLAVPETRIWGSVLGAMILFVATVSLLNHRKYAYAVPAILVMVALAPAAI
jgi:hypothetical protein